MSSVPAPFYVSPSGSWDGHDGIWSTFHISVGTPPQDFRVLPSTTGAETWIPIPEGCEGSLVNIADCGTLRGVDSFDGSVSRGFQSNASSTWDLMGIYELATEKNLWGETSNQGLYGLDTVSLDSYGSGRTIEAQEQTVAGVATANVWLGSLGLGTASAHFDVRDQAVTSLLVSMRRRNYIPGLSFGYTAGASYTLPETPGSLILGGYDQSRFESSDVNFTVGGEEGTSLPVTIESIIAEDAFGGTLSLLSGGSWVTTAIDSTVSQMWLPQSVCDLFAQAFGLKYDSGTGLYLVNNTIHQQLQQMNPSVTFTIGGSGNSGSTTNIKLPYSAFDLQASIPLFNYSTNYFPLRVAANESQQVLGRAFLQEAYLFVDWDRDYFTLSQATHQASQTDIVPVLSPSYDTPTSEDDPALGTGAIVGIAIGACAVVAVIVGLAALFIIRSRRKRRSAAEVEEILPTELHDEPVKPPEIMSAQVYELQEGENSKHELETKQVSELQAASLEQELDGDGERFGKYGRGQKKHNVYYEME